MQGRRPVRRPRRRPGPFRPGPGVALRTLISSLNDAEAAFYYVNYHARLPYLELTARDASKPGNFPIGRVQGPAKTPLRLGNIIRCCHTEASCLNP